MRFGLALLALLALASCVPQGVDSRLPDEGNGAFVIEGDGEKGLLLIHGLSATPWEVRSLAEFVAAENVTVMAPLMPGHGTSPKDLENVKWTDWYAESNRSYTELKSKVSRVFVGGVSTGADLALLLAAEHDVDGVIAIAPPIDFVDKKASLAPLVYPVMPYISVDLLPEEVGHYYAFKPTKSVAELLKMISAVKKALPGITEPMLILQSVHDPTVSPSSSRYVFYNAGSKSKEWRLYSNASHILVHDPGADNIVFNSVREFVVKH